MSFSNLRPLYPQRAFNRDNTPISSTTFSVTTTATSSQTFTAYPNQSGVQLVSFDIQGNDVYVRWDSVDPVASAGGGHVLPAGSAYTWPVDQYNSTRWIASSTANVFASGFNAG